MRIVWRPTTTVRCVSEIRRTTPKCRGGSRTRTSWSCRGRSRAWRSAATTTSCGRRTCSGRSPTRIGGGGRRRRCRRTLARSDPAVHGERSDLRQGLSHGQRGERAATPRRRRRVLVSRASAHEVHGRLPGRDLGHEVSEERSLPRRCLQARHGPGQLRGDDVRVALLRRRGHDEQPERGHGHRPEVRHRRYRHVPEEPRGRHVRELPGQLSEDRHRAGTGPGLESGAEGDARRQLLRDHRRDSDQELRGHRHRQSADDYRGC